jgi:arylsulfatase A-like enzyme
MKRLTIHRTCVFILFSICYLQFYSCKMVADQDKYEIMPNIIIFYADDLGWVDLGIQGSKYYETPNIDRIGKAGMRFTNAYANAANCAPSRACLMTGMYSPRHGVYTVLNSDRGPSKHRKLIPTENQTILDTNLLSMPQFFKNQGYQTCIAGKWHLSKDPLDYGFDTNFGGNHRGAPKSYFSPYKNPQLRDGPVGEHLPDRLSNDISDWIIDHKDNPFFVYFPFYSVHTPIQAREDLTNKYENKEPGEYHDKPSYAAMIEAMDLAIGKVLDVLEAQNLTKETIIIFTSDNGAHGGQTLSRPLRGSKGMFYEGGIRVPFLIQWEGQIEANSINSTPIIGSDLLPTFMEILNGKVTEGLDGESLMRIFTNQTSQERPLFWHFPAYLQSYKSDRAFEDSHDKPWFRSAPVSVIRKGDWKLLEFFEHGDLELYNLKEDIGERNNLVEKNLDKKKELYRLLKEWQQQTNAPIPIKLNPEYQSN